jgi:cystathionine gamma-lyase
MINFETIAIHVGSEPDANSGAVTPAISLATTFAQAELGNKAGVLDPNSHGLGFEYGRCGNPTRGAFERQLAACEGGKHGIAFSSGLGAINAVMALLNPNDHVVCIDDVYGGAQRLFRKIIGPKVGVEFTFMDMSDPATVAAAIKSNTKMVWVESPTNPTLKVSDISSIATSVHDVNSECLVIVDNTFASPYLQNPLKLGADIVMHSVTKYIGGHSDVLMGALVINSDELNEQLRFNQYSMGAVPSPFDCYMSIRGMKTLAVRMEAAMKNAMTIATFLHNAPSYVSKVLYPGLKSHPGHDIARQQMRGYGAMVSFHVNGTIDETSKFLKSLKIFTLAESLGAVESLAECPAIMTHASVSPEHRALIGISDNLIRLSIGIEHIDDLLQDISQALAAAFIK